jgi:hypothetical protein
MTGALLQVTGHAGTDQEVAMAETANETKRTHSGAGAERPGPNEGEGSQTGARQYNEATRAFVRDGKVKDAAKKAEHDVDGPEAEDLKQAEAEGKKHAHGEDPLLRR